MSPSRLPLLFLVCLCTVFAGCGGSTSGSDGGTGGAGGGSGNDDGGAAGDPTQRVVRIGSFDPTGDFIEGRIGSDKTRVQAGQQALLSVRLIDENGALVTAATDIFFSSPCTGNGIADIDPAVVGNIDGQVTTTYTARGCDGTDLVRAQTSIDGNTLIASRGLVTEQAPLGSIQFVSAAPATIGIQGSGALPEQAAVTFLVTNSSGGPVANQAVDFSLSTSVGGITLTPSQGTSDANGRVSTTVASGAVATTVRVIAAAMRGGITTMTQSSGLAITTGLPDNNSFSLSARPLNIEGWEFDGVSAQLTIRAADRFNNPVPDGTAVAFTTEGGAIVGSCNTSNGTCSVTLTSQSPRPPDGRVTVLATAIGEESFVDSLPSNGRFDDAETLFDLPEAFRDDNANGIRESNEPFVDFNSDGSYNLANGEFDGLLCAGPARCGTDAVTVRDSIEIVFSGTSLFVATSPDPIALTGGNATVTVTVQDGRGQKPPAGTTVSASTSQGTIVGPASFIQQSTNSPGPAVFHFFLAPGEDEGDGTFLVEVITPGPGTGPGTRSTDIVAVDQTP